MKKIILYILICNILFGLVGCNTPKDDNINGTETTLDSSLNKTDETTEIIEDTPKAYTLQVPGHNIYMDYPANIKNHNDGYAEIFHKNYDYAVGFIYEPPTAEQKFIGTYKEIPELFKFLYIAQISTVSNGWLYGNEYEIVETEEVKLGDIEALKFTAIVLNRETWYCHIYGYAFFMDNTPCMLAGIVSHKDQAVETVKEMEELVETILPTIRTEK